MILTRPLLIGVIFTACQFFQTDAVADAPAGAKAYQVDTAASRAFIKVTSGTRLGHPHGVEGRLKSGKLTFGGDGDLVFDMSTFTADTTESRKRAGLEGEKTSASDAQKVTQTMRGADVLDTARFATATFHMNVIQPSDGQAAGAPGMYKVQGAFTLHGVEKKIELNAKLEPADQPPKMRFSGSFKIKQSDYGIKPYSTLGGAVKVADELEITGDLLLSSEK